MNVRTRYKLQFRLDMDGLCRRAKQGGLSFAPARIGIGPNTCFSTAAGAAGAAVAAVAAVAAGAGAACFCLSLIHISEPTRPY